jgi:hypothetical protein
MPMAPVMEWRVVTIGGGTVYNTAEFLLSKYVQLTIDGAGYQKNIPVENLFVLVNTQQYKIFDNLGPSKPKIPKLDLNRLQRRDYFASAGIPGCKATNVGHDKG